MRVERKESKGREETSGAALSRIGAEPMSHLSLFSGIGGIDLAADWAGFKTVAFVEQDPFCQKVLRKHWPEVPIYDDVTTLDGSQFRGIDLLSGGFPCQPYSQAGKQLGADDDRALWPAMLRVIRDSNPDWVLGENVAGFVGMGLDACLSDLEAEGYEATAVVLPACGVGAPHQRYRVFIVANSRSGRRDAGPVLCAGAKSGGSLAGYAGEALADSARDLQSGATTQRAERERARLCGESITLADATCELLDGTGNFRQAGRRESANGGWWEFEPAVGRVAHGIPRRVDRLRALGNAVVPQQVFPILQAIGQQIRANRQAPVERQKRPTVPAATLEAAKLPN